MSTSTSLASRTNRQPPRRTLIELAREPQLGEVIIEHAFRGARVQRLLRLVLVVYLAFVLVFVPPAGDVLACWVLVGGYAAWTVALGIVVDRGGTRFLRYVWLAVLVDVAALAVVMLVAAEPDPLSWTAYLVANGFFLLPVIAATSLSPGVCAAAVVPTVIVYLVASMLAWEPGIEPIWSPVLRTGLLGGLGLGCVLLSRLQRSRVLTIGGLVGDRNELVGELLSLEEREQRDLAETLHDGALQYVLAARQDLEDLSTPERAEEFARVDYALTEASRLLRSTMAQLHPAVLDHAGLAAALRDLVTTVGSRGSTRIDLEVHDWPVETRTSADPLLLGAARELLTNVIKHAGADRAQVRIGYDGTSAVLQVRDDGRGMAGVDLAQRLTERHLGVASRRIRIEAAGGTLRYADAVPHGTIATVQVPARPVP